MTSELGACALLSYRFLPDVSNTSKWIIYHRDKFSSLNLGLNKVNYFLRQPNNQEKQPAKPRLLQEAFHPRLNVAWTKLRNMNENVQDWGEFVNRYTSCSSRNSSPDRDRVFGDVKRTPSPVLPLFSSSDKHFCRRDNIDQCLAYLNQVSVYVRDNPCTFSCRLYKDWSWAAISLPIACFVLWQFVSPLVIMKWVVCLNRIDHHLCWTVIIL